MVNVLPYFHWTKFVFLERWTPKNIGDYANGTNHVLPMYGYSQM
jgi:histidinol dehydrogenase